MTFSRVAGPWRVAERLGLSQSRTPSGPWTPTNGRLDARALQAAFVQCTTPDGLVNRLAAEFEFRAPSMLSPPYMWEEDSLSLTIRVLTRGVTRDRVDTFFSPEYVALNAPPYFLELDLRGSIIAEESVTSLSCEHLVLRLRKAVCGRWERLLVELSCTDRLARRKRSRAAAEAAAAAAATRKKKTAWVDTRSMLTKQME